MNLRKGIGIFVLSSLAMKTGALARGAATSSSPAAANAEADRLHARYPEPKLPFEIEMAEPEADDSLAAALADAYSTNPSLGARRYELRATDDALGSALAETRTTAQVQVAAGYEFTDPGRITSLSRFSTANIRRDDLGAQVIVDQPLYTGGRAAADLAAAKGDIRAGRAGLRGAEGDLLVAVITAYADMRRDERSLAIRLKAEEALAATLEEVIARRSAGELTRTDIAQAQVQLQTARATANAARAQVEQSRSSFNALVGRGPGKLAPLPSLPLLPGDLDEAFETASSFNPDLAQAIEAEKASRARIAAARAGGRPTVSLRGIAGTTGVVSPLHGYNEDLSWSGRATLTIPILNGGRVGAQVDQALDRNSADRFRIEIARRQMVQDILTAWNQMVAAKRNTGVQREQLKAAKIFYEGTLAEYRNGLRSTFDVLYAQNQMRDTQVALLSSEHDDFVAQARLLRDIGQLEISKLMAGNALYDPTQHVREVEKRASMPWDGLVRTYDRIGMPSQKQQVLRRPPLPVKTPIIVESGAPKVAPEFESGHLHAPPPGTSGTPEKAYSR